MIQKIVLAGMVAAGLTAVASGAEKSSRLAIMHTNDTHSQLDPLDDTDMGGILRRKVLIDSIRAAEPNAMLVDVGDVVQGSLFFTLYKGDVENALMDSLGYDLRILGNHEFDNGAEDLARRIRNTRSTWLATNYDVSKSALAGRFQPYYIKEVGGKKVGFIALNLKPQGMISEGNYNGVEYLDMYKAANSTAWHLKHNEGVDYVIALTHIGYWPSGTGTSDRELAAASEDIDAIIGGHSHTTVDPADNSPKAAVWRVANAVGDTIPVVQTGKSGRNLGQLVLDVDNGTFSYKLIPVDARLDSRVDKSLEKVIEPYRAGVDSIMNLKVASSARALSNSDAALLNFVADYIKLRGSQLAKNVDFAITNKGGIRRGLPKGKVTQGVVINMLPFNNKVTVIDVKGRDLAENFDIMAVSGGNGLSREVEAVFDPKTKKCVSIKVNGQPLDPDKTYRVATIDYLANGGDYMKPLTRGSVVATAPRKLSDDIVDWMKKEFRSRKINPSDTPRMYPQR